MKIKIYFSLGLLTSVLMWANLGFAQNSLTVEQAMEAAIQNRSNSKVSKLEKEDAKLALKEAQLVLYPRVNAGLDYKHNLIRPTTILPGALVGNPNGDDIPVQFGTNYNATGFLDFNIGILNSPLGKDIQIAKKKVELAGLSAEADEKQIREDVIAVYYAILVNMDRQTQLQADLSEAKSLRKDMETRVAAGLVNEIDAERLRSKERQIAIDIEKQVQLIALSKMRLNLAMGNPVDQAIEPADRLDAFNPVDLPEEKPITRLDFLQLRSAQISLRIAQMETERLKHGLLPTVSAYGYLGAQGFGNNLKFFSSEDFPWYGISYIGLRAALPINNFFNYKTQSKRQQISVQKAQLQLDELRQQSDFELLEVSNLQNQARIDLKKAQEQLNLAEKNLAFVNTRVISGLALSEDLVSALTERSNAKIACLIAQYNLIQAIWKQRILAEQY